MNIDSRDENEDDLYTSNDKDKQWPKKVKKTEKHLCKKKDLI